MAILLALALGGTPIGAPIVGWVADAYGPRWGLAVGASAGLAATIVGIYYLVKFRHFRAWFESGQFRVSFDETDLTVGKLP